MRLRNEALPVGDVRRAYLLLVAISKRQRKEKNHYVELGFWDESTTPDNEELNVSAWHEIAEFKYVRRATLHLDIGTHRDDGIMIQQLCDPRSTRRTLVRDGVVVTENDAA